MESIEGLSYKKQIMRLRKVARTALEAYDFSNYKLSLLLHGMNTTFVVEDYTNELGEEKNSPFVSNKYVLRIHPENWLDEEFVTSEMRLLLMLRENGNLPVSEPIWTKNKGLVQRVLAEGESNPRCCVLYKWVGGKFQTLKLSDQNLINMGELLGRFHNLGEESIDPMNYKRPISDWHGFFDKGGMFYTGVADLNFTKEQLEIVNIASEKIEKRISELEKNKENFGFIHGDIYFRNVLFHRGEIRAIDFDLCGFGYYLYDLAVPFWPSKQGDVDKALEKVICGYRKVRILTKEKESYIKDFLAVRRLIDAKYFAIHFREIRFSEIAPVIISGATSELKKYLEATS